jgi:hypothetical protein
VLNERLTKVSLLVNRDSGIADYIGDEMKKTNFRLISLVCLLILMVIILFIVFVRNQGREPSAREIRSLIDDMTKTPYHQQKALDELAKYGDSALIYLPCYFDDERPIASENVKFLNTNKNAIEKYFITGGKKVSDVVIQYYCWSEEKCAVELSKIEETRQKLSDDSMQCKLHHNSNSVR